MLFDPYNYNRNISEGVKVLRPYLPWFQLI